MTELLLLAQIEGQDFQRIAIIGLSIIISLLISAALIYVIHEMLDLLGDPPEPDPNSIKGHCGRFSAISLYLLVLVVVTELTLLGAERLANLILETLYGIHHELTTITEILGMESGLGPILILAGILSGLLGLVAILETIESYITPNTKIIRRELEGLLEETETEA